MVKVEICINSDCLLCVRESANIAYQGGASTIELCSAMQFNGLTPKREHIIEARESFNRKNGLMVMIRPRNGHFAYFRQEIQVMVQQIKTAAEVGADGVVFGALRKSDHCIDVDSLRELMATSRKYNLKVTFHRAFDATPDPLTALDILIESGVDRVLTSGTIWEKLETALAGVKRLNQIIVNARGRIEIVIGGGINSQNVEPLLHDLPLMGNKISVHAYSGVQVNGIISLEKVKSLVNAVEYF